MNVFDLYEILGDNTDIFIKLSDEAIKVREISNFGDESNGNDEEMVNIDDTIYNCNIPHIKMDVFEDYNDRYFICLSDSDNHSEEDEETPKLLQHVFKIWFREKKTFSKKYTFTIDARYNNFDKIFKKANKKYHLNHENSNFQYARFEDENDENMATYYFVADLVDKSLLRNVLTKMRKLLKEKKDIKMNHIIRRILRIKPTQEILQSIVEALEEYQFDSKIKSFYGIKSFISEIKRNDEKAKLTFSLVGSPGTCAAVESDVLNFTERKAE